MLPNVGIVEKKTSINKSIINRETRVRKIRTDNLTIAYSETRIIRSLASKLGADLSGVASLSLYQDSYGVSKPLLSRYPFGISIAIRLSDEIIDRISEEDPTEAYVHHYKQVNALLDNMASKIAEYCEDRGCEAVSIPASQVIDELKLVGIISHKAVAALAGIGWLGRSLLIVNEKFGPRIRLASILTTLPLIANSPVKNRCGECTICVKTCPVQAIKGVYFTERPSSREETLDARACNERLLEIESNPRFGTRICGICAKVCPFGKKSAAGNKKTLSGAITQTGGHD